MVKIDNKQIYSKMDPRKLEKIQIYPSKQHCGYSKVSNQLPKLTKTIMSPLTTMPPKKLNMNAPQIISIKPNSPHQQNMKANEKQPPLSMTASNNNAAMQFSAMKNNFVNKNNAFPMNAPKTANVVAQPKSEPAPKVEEKVKVTAASYRSEEISLDDVHPYITCFLCRGYLIEATTIVECLHTFCHSCLMKHLAKEASLSCPQCKMIINKSKTNIKYDATIQSIVYKLVPGLYHKELLRRRAFYKLRPAEAKLASPEERGDDTEHLILSPQDMISLSLDYAEKETLSGMESDENIQNLLKPKYLNCPAVFKVEHLKKFIVSKFLINSHKFNVEISYKVKTIVLPEHYTLMDVAYIYTWKKEAPMPFFFRIIAKNSKCDELPEVALRRSPTTTLPNVADETNTKKKSVSFKEEVESIEAKPEHNNKVTSNKSDNMRKPSDYPPNAPRIETIKLKLDASNNNVSIIKNTDSTTKSDMKQRQRAEKKEKKSKLENLLPKYSIDNEKSSPRETKKDEYEFDDDIDQQKLGFLNTFQLTAKKILSAKANMKNDSRSFKSDCTSSTNNKNNLSQKQTENNINKRKSKEPVKSASKKYKFHEMKSVGEGNKFLFTKTGDGHEITFDMSPKPLGSKPPLSKVKSDIMLAQQRADAKASKEIKPEVKAPVQVVEQPDKMTNNNQRTNVPIKPKKLPMLLPKQPSPVAAPSVAPSSVSPTAFVIKKPEAKKDFASNEISVTKVSDQNHSLRVYGPKSPVNTTPKQESPVSPQFKSPDGFAQPFPPKVKSNIPKPPPNQIFNPYGPPRKMPKNIPENMQTPYGCRTPFYDPSSPSYTPNYGSLPKFKYTNPGAYAPNAFSLMQSMFGVGNAGKISPPINSTSPKTSGAVPRKRPSPDKSPNVPMKRKTPSPTKDTETDSKTIEILNKIHFPKSLSVTLTNEQEENKKEQLRSQKQSSVNNNIEIIKLSEEKDLKAASANAIQKSSNTSPVDKNLSNDKKSSEGKKLSPKMPGLLPNPESFQRAFLESINAMQGIEKNSAGRKSSKLNATETSGKDDKDKVMVEIKTEENANFEQKGSLVPKSFCKMSEAPQASSKKNLSRTPPPTKPEKAPMNSVKSHTPPPDPNVFAANAAQQSMLLQLMGMNPFSAAVKSSHLLDYANMNIDAVRRQMLFETLRQNALAMQHQIQQQQQQKSSPSSHSPSTASSGSSPSSKR